MIDRSAHPLHLIVTHHQDVLDPMPVLVVVGAGQRNLVGVEDEVVRGITAGVGGQLPAVVVERSDEVDELVARPVHVAEIARPIEMRLGEQHAAGFARSAKSLTPPIRKRGLNSCRGR